MASRELHLELLVGCCVYDCAGDRVGHIQEIRAQKCGDDWEIVEYLVGVSALVERLSAWGLAANAIDLLGANRQGYRIPWDKLDLSDPERPCLTCTRAELERIGDR